MNAAEDVRLLPRLAAADSRAAELLDLIALLADFSGRMPRSPSRGQVQRVGAACPRDSFDATEYIRP